TDELERTILADPSEAIADVLRRFRQRHIVRIVWRDFCRLADTIETMRDMTLLAEACISAAVQFSHKQFAQRFGTPIGRDSGAGQEMIVLAMGKLGASELNVSSDVDLIFVYPEKGETDSETNRISNEEFFTRVGRSVIQLLDQVTAEGFVFRVDMRLRPYGESGALVHNFSSLYQYYQEQGRDWERYALVKAHPITGDAERAAELMRALRPFVFRKYVDFTVVDSLRDMKAMIREDVQRRGLQDDIKLGLGGIRELEFVAQSFQLIRGGRDRNLQQRKLLPVLRECQRQGCLSQEAVIELRSAYLFLRDTEHAIQGYRDQQTHALPSDTLNRAAVACVMGFANWEDFLSMLSEHRGHVAAHFESLIAEPIQAQTSSSMQAPALWGEGLSPEVLSGLGFHDVSGSYQALAELQQSSKVLGLSPQGRERVDQFMPQLLRACAQAHHPDLTLQRVLPLVVSVLRRSVYLALLLENPEAISELTNLCSASPWIAEQLAQHPILLDELLDQDRLYSTPDLSALRAELTQEIASLTSDDLESQMDALRLFKSKEVLRVAASELMDRQPLMRVSDQLSWIAQVCLEHALKVAWNDMVEAHGEPERESEDTGFVVLGYGKLGGYELSYGSDLDLVFVSDGSEGGVTNGSRSLDNTVFYTRLGQRVIHILEARTTLGQLYEVDMRLRPSGHSGMLVSSVSAFRSYQEESAWTWEHQALVRARYVAGDPSMAQRIESVRVEALARTRDARALAQEVQSMRQKMSEHSLPKHVRSRREFDIKRSPGGIIDVEFLVQYAVLAWSHRVPELTRFTDNANILEVLGQKGLFEPSRSEALTEAYLALRARVHQLTLQQHPVVVAANQLKAHRKVVTETWEEVICQS
ncbi:MAG: bifunctional [glutamate--ammonia ligase]-adenylyl-L-tyrosine phosphorylase/[glutamate--ammonia-ligase] adenylyltransferase, partial [Pseudomonadota bacterium]